MKTPRLVEETRLKSEQYFRIGWLNSPLNSLWKMGLTKAKTVLHYLKALPELESGTANTSIEFHQGKLFALQEASLPFRFNVKDDGYLESLGYCSFNKQLTHNMTAHPKV